MSKSLGWILLSFSWLVLLSACQSESMDDGGMIVEPGEPVSFAQDVLPIFRSSCGGGACHITASTNGVNLNGYTQVMSSVGLQYGRAIVSPGNPDNSPLVNKLGPSPQFGVRMPEGQAALSGTQIGLIRAWIDEGAENN